MKEEIISANAPAPAGPYSQAIEANGFLFISGQIALTPTGELMQSSLEEEVKLIMKNLKDILDAADLDFSNVVRTEIFLTNMNNFGEINSIYETFMPKPYPARFTVGVKELPKGARVEIAMIAAR